MRVIKNLFDFYINSSIHVSLAVVALMLVTQETLDISLSWTFLLFAFSSTVTGYNFVKYAEVAGLHHRSLAKSLRQIQLFSGICGMVMVITVFWLSREALLACVLLGGLTLFYAVPIFSRKRNLRNIKSLKIIIIALVWAGVTVLLPALQQGLEIYWDLVLIGAQRFLFVLAVMIPFEIRDMKYDSPLLGTLPQMLGTRGTKLVGYLLLVAFVTLELFKDNLQESELVIIGFVGLIVSILIALSRKSQSRYYASFVVEAVPFFWLLLIGVLEVVY